MIDLVPYGVVTADADGMATAVNRRWLELTGQSGDDWRGRGWLQVCDAADRQSRQDELFAAVRSGAPHRSDWPITHAELGRRTLHLQAVPDLDDGHLVRIVVAAADVTAERTRTASLLEQATHDSLTGLFNRAQFLEFLSHALDRRRRAPERVAAVLFVDVDDLKLTNDTFGHDAGDDVLRDVAARVKAGVRPADIVARYGGDEFTILCEDLSDAGEAAVIADRIRTAARADPPLGISIGVALAGEPGADPASIVASADRAMFRAKHRSARAPSRSSAWATVPVGGAAGQSGRPRRSGPRIDARAAAVELQGPLATVAGLARTLRAERALMPAAEVDAALAAIEHQTRQLEATLDRLVELDGAQDVPAPDAPREDHAEVSADRGPATAPPHPPKP